MTDPPGHSSRGHSRAATHPSGKATRLSSDSSIVQTREFSKAHEEETARFGVLKDHGFIFRELTNPYEVVRMYHSFLFAPIQMSSKNLLYVFAASGSSIRKPMGLSR